MDYGGGEGRFGFSLLTKEVRFLDVTVWAMTSQRTHLFAVDANFKFIWTVLQWIPKIFDQKFSA